MRRKTERQRQVCKNQRAAAPREMLVRAFLAELSKPVAFMLGEEGCAAGFAISTTGLDEAQHMASRQSQALDFTVSPQKGSTPSSNCASVERPFLIRLCRHSPSN